MAKLYEWVAHTKTGVCYHRIAYGDQNDVYVTVCGMDRAAHDFNAIRLKASEIGKVAHMMMPCRVCFDGEIRKAKGGE